MLEARVSDPTRPDQAVRRRLHTPLRFSVSVRRIGTDMELVEGGELGRLG